MSKRRVRTIVALVLLAGSGAVAGAQVPVERDEWYVLVDGEQHYGYEHVEVTRLPGGDYRYASESRMLIDLFGAQRQELTSRGEYVVSPAWRPISISAESARMSGSSTVTGRMEGQTLTITVTRDGADHASVFEFDETESVIVDICLGDWLAALPAQTQRAEARVIERETWNVGTIVATRSGPAPGPAWDIQVPGSPRRGTITYDADGVVREMQYHAPPLHLRRGTPEEAGRIDYRVWSGRELLTFPLDREINAPHRLRGLTVALAWKDIPFEEFDLEDARQQLVERSEADGRYTAVVRIGPPGAIPADKAYPIDDETFRRSLSETEFIKPRDERIAAAARRIVEGKTTALAAVQSLCEWVNGHVESTLIAETLSGPEVLAQRKGKCSEFSTLFASLARSAGIPTRIALGERLAGGQWLGHMWNEAYVGAWIPVDAGANEVGESYALLKFVHSDTVGGTQPLRWKLTESLEISIRDFELTESALASAYRTGIDGRTYTNVDYACRITAPEPAWQLEDKSRGGHVTIRFKVSDAEDVLIHFVAFGLPPGTEPSALTGARVNMIKSRYEGFELLADEPCEIGGSRGHTTRFRGTATDDPQTRYMTTEVVWTRDAFGFLLNLIAPEAAHDEYLPSFRALLAGFEHLDRHPQGR